MPTMLRLAIPLLLLCAGTALAQAGADRTYTLQPAEVDTIGCQFVDRTVTNANKGTATAVKRGGTTADTDPTAMLVGHGAATAGSDWVDVQVYPDAGCATSGCRNGNEYEIVLQPRDTSAADPNAPNMPLCNLYVIVKQKSLRR